MMTIDWKWKPFSFLILKEIFRGKNLGTELQINVVVEDLSDLSAKSSMLKRPSNSA